MPSPGNEAASTPAKLECLEAIRGLAASTVVVGHLVLGFWPALIHRNGPLWEPVPFWLQTLCRFPGKFLLNGELGGGLDEQTACIE